jgi:hypothetical protein
LLELAGLRIAAEMIEQRPIGSSGPAGATRRPALPLEQPKQLSPIGHAAREMSLISPNQLPEFSGMHFNNRA